MRPSVVNEAEPQETSKPPTIIRATVYFGSGDSTLDDDDKATLATVVDCTTQGGATPTPVCTPAQVAAYDLQRWAAALQAIIPNPNSTITCTINVTVPVNCTIQISWSENSVAVNKQSVATSGAFLVPTYTLTVEP